MKTNKNKKWIIALLVITMIAMYGFLPPANDANAIDAIRDASDTLSNSDVDEPSLHTFTFTTGTTTPVGGYIDIVFHADFGDVGSTSCDTADGNWTPSQPNTETARCTATAVHASSTYTITVPSVQNPITENSYRIDITHYNNLGTVLERAQVRVAIIEDVTMSATVDATLDFNIFGVNSGTAVNNINCDQTSTATSVPFGVLSLTASTTVCQRLTVTTNADDGYTVTVEQDDEMRSDSNSTINSFNNSVDGSGSTTPQFWAAPNNTLDAEHTYGHMGLTSDDATLDTTAWGEADPYNNAGGTDATSEYVGFNGYNQPVQVMYHTGPADGTTDDIGEASVAYTIEIGSLQEAGDYENKITYICTPTF